MQLAYRPARSIRCRGIKQGGLAIAVTLLGTIMAATTGIVGASVIMLTLIALPVMLRSGYDKALSAGIHSFNPLRDLHRCHLPYQALARGERVR